MKAQGVVSMDINNRPITSIRKLQDEYLKSNQVKNNSSTTTNTFDSIFKQTIQKSEGLKFSKHANLRLNSRNIEISDEQMNKIEQGVQNAEQKGIKESLVLVDNIALVVNVANKTVITALDKQESGEHIFTNIDGAVIL
jgi:flagellar operon protein